MVDKTKILDAIKLIAENHKGECNFNVDSYIHKEQFSRKNATKKTIIHIELTEPI